MLIFLIELLKLHPFGAALVIKLRSCAGKENVIASSNCLIVLASPRRWASVCSTLALSASQSWLHLGAEIKGRVTAFLHSFMPSTIIII